MNRVHERGSHQRSCFSKKEDLDLMACFQQSITVEEREGCLCRVIGTPGAFYKYLAHNSSFMTLMHDSRFSRPTASITRAADAKDSFAGATRRNYPNISEAETVAASGACNVGRRSGVERTSLYGLLEVLTRGSLCRRVNNLDSEQDCHQATHYADYADQHHIRSYDCIQRVTCYPGLESPPTTNASPDH